MALETLDNVKEIGGYPVATEKEIKEFWINIMSREQAKDWDIWREQHPVVVDHDHNTLSFKIQSGPVKEVGVNGCQVDTLIEAARLILVGLNEKFPSAYNDNAINKLEMALYWLKQRTIDREQRGVEGTSNG